MSPGQKYSPGINNILWSISLQKINPKLWLGLCCKFILDAIEILYPRGSNVIAFFAMFGGKSVCSDSKSEESSVFNNTVGYWFSTNTDIIVAFRNSFYFADLFGFCFGLPRVLFTALSFSILYNVVREFLRFQLGKKKSTVWCEPQSIT